MNTKKSVRVSKTVIAFLISAAFGGAHAAKIDEAISKAVTSNPDVMTKWHQFHASAAERKVSWGRYLPTLDYVIGTGRESRESPTVQPKRSYDVDSQKLTLRQNLFEGFGTENDVARLEHASLVRYYEFLDLSEVAALEAAKAYIDVYRFRKLVEMAEENYAVHRLVFDKLSARAKSGVSRGVDLEMASARLALAESNLLTEASNLHDVSARYQRVVGDQPAGELEPPAVPLTKAIPNSREQAVATGFQTSPQLKAAIENILSAQRNVTLQRSGYYPRVDAYAEASRESNVNAITGNTKVSAVGVTMSWNLFRGQQDSSKIEKAVQEASAAKDVRERVCRDLRQNLSMAYNDQKRLTEQLPFLDQHQLSTDKAREALRRQFDIGERTLLDVLDTENEYYTARRNYLNGEMDLMISQVKYLASSGTLLDTLKLKHLDGIEPPQPQTELDADAVNQCPPEPAKYPAFDKQAVYERAKAKEEMLRSSAALPGTGKAK
jgi:adhesin transport system outer membrane protein